MGNKLQDPISRVQYLFVFVLPPLTAQVRDLQPSASLPCSVKCSTRDASAAAAPAVLITMTARTQKRRLPYIQVNIRL